MTNERLSSPSTLRKEVEICRQYDVVASDIEAIRHGAKSTTEVAMADDSEEKISEQNCAPKLAAPGTRKLQSIESTEKFRQELQKFATQAARTGFRSI